MMRGQDFGRICGCGVSLFENNIVGYIILRLVKILECPECLGKDGIVLGFKKNMCGVTSQIFKQRRK
jgi:hypothetical protein